MSEEETIFERIKARGEVMFQQVSGELMANPRFMAAMQSALRGKEKLDDAAARALKAMNVPTRTEFKKALRRIDALENELAAARVVRPKKGAKRRSPRKKTGGR
jgi:hypothetical protein